MLKDTITQALKGVAIADASLVGWEFKDRDWIAENIKFDQFYNHRAEGFEENLHPGEYSDDAEHTIAMTRALSSNEEFSSLLLIKLFRDEYVSDKVNKGYGRQGHGSIRHWYEGEKTIEQVREMQAERSDPGNAPIMRILPLAFLPTEVISEYAKINAESTHPHTTAVEWSIAAARIAEYLLVKDGEMDGLVDYVSNYVSASTADDLARVLTLPSRDSLSEADWEFLCGPQPIEQPDLQKFGIEIFGLNCSVSKTVLTCLYVLNHSKNAFEALQNSAVMGGDVDSLGAFTVGIMAGRTGLDSLPDALVQGAEGLDRIEELAEELSAKLDLSET